MSIPYSAKKQQAGAASSVHSFSSWSWLLGQQEPVKDTDAIFLTPGFFNDPLSAMHTAGPQSIQGQAPFRHCLLQS